jgi:iron-sulfur cluster repair protein YtfE (RIC family)
MKRAAPLQQLSRDHHRALVVARRLKRADSSTALEAGRVFSEFWRSDGEEHFQREEQVLLPGVAAYVEPDTSVVVRVLTDHVRIRHLAARAGDSPEPETLHELGTSLEGHVRLEERELFPLLERVVPEAELVQLAARL